MPLELSTLYLASSSDLKKIVSPYPDIRHINANDNVVDGELK